PVGGAPLPARPYPTRRYSDLAGLPDLPDLPDLARPAGLGGGNATEVVRNRLRSSPGSSRASSTCSQGLAPGYGGASTGLGSSARDRKRTRLNSSHVKYSYAVF